MTASEQRVYDDLANSPFDQLMGFDISEISQDGLTLVFHNVGTAWDTDQCLPRVKGMNK